MRSATCSRAHCRRGSCGTPIASSAGPEAAPPDRMSTFVIRRILQAIPLLLGVSALTFLLIQLAPGDYLATIAENPQISQATLEGMRHRFGLDQPWWVQYLLYLKNVFLHLDFGESFSRH